MAVQEHLLFSDLPALDSSPNSVRESFKTIYGTNPDGIALNNETYFNAVQPPITQQYGHYCYKKIGDITYNYNNNNLPTQIIIATSLVTNETNEPVTQTVYISGEWTKTTSWSTEVTNGLSFSSSISIKGIFEIGGEFNVSTTVGKSESQSITNTASLAITVEVPPRSQRRVKLKALMVKEAARFSAPINVSGYFGANFPKSVNGHYFWFVGASNLLNKTYGTLTGIIENTTAYEFEGVVETPVSYDDLKQSVLNDVKFADPQ